MLIPVYSPRFFLSSHDSRTSHCPLVIFRAYPSHSFSTFLDVSFSVLVLLRYLSTTPTLNTSVPLTQLSTPYSPLFVGKMHRVTSRLVHLAVDLVALHLLAYPRAQKTGFGFTQPCSWNRPLDQGSTTGSNLAVELAPCTLSA